MRFIQSQGEDNTSSRQMQGKRVLANYESCKTDLASVMQKLFNAYEEALKTTNVQLLNFNPEHRSKTLEASLMQSNISAQLFSIFPNNTKWGKYRRLVLRINGYVILFKKLDNKGKPMNIKTRNVESILNQQQTLNLFDTETGNEEPILYFGYQKDKLRGYQNPQIVYIDDNEVMFAMLQENLIDSVFLEKGINNANEASPSLRNDILKKAK